MTQPPKSLRILHRCLVFAVIASMSVTAAMAALMLAFPDLETQTTLIVAIPGLVAAGFLLWLTYASVALRDQRPMMRIACLAGAAMAAIGTTCVIFAMVADERGARYELVTTFARAGALGFALAVALAYSAALRQVLGRSRLLTTIAIITLIAAWVASGLVTLLSVGLDALEAMNSYDVFLMLASLTGIAVLVMLAGTIVVPVALISRALKERQAVESLDPRLQVRLACPKCGERQTHKPGFARCSGCGAGLFIEVEEPRCDCGYLLYQLTGDTCPECGRPVAAN